MAAAGEVREVLELDEDRRLVEAVERRRVREHPLEGRRRLGVDHRHGGEVRRGGEGAHGGGAGCVRGTCAVEGAQTAEAGAVSARDAGWGVGERGEVGGGWGGGGAYRSGG